MDIQTADLPFRKIEADRSFDALAAAIVCCPPQHYEHTAAVTALRGVLGKAKDLNAYVQTLDDQASKTGQDSPLLRKAIGQVYQQQKDYARVIPQLEIARQLQAGDHETCQALIAGYDALGQPGEATGQLLALVDFDRHDVKLYVQLAERLKTNPAEAERAATSIVEADPGEAENHRALAQLRQRQNAWNQAIDEWTEVDVLQPLEPTGLVGLAQSQAHQKQWEPLRKTLDALKAKQWPPQFAGALQKAEGLRKKLPK